jgi:hypothetical protein
MLSRRTALVAIAVSAGLVAGCTSHTRSVEAGSPSQSGSAGNPADRQAEAQRDAHDRLASFRPPPGAKQLTGQPAGGITLNEFDGLTGGPDTTATATSWWQAPGEPQAVLASLATPSGASIGGRSSTDGPQGATSTVVFSWPRQGVLVGRSLGVTATRGGGGTILRVDAGTVWVPQRDPATFVPAGVRSVVISFQPDPIGLGSTPKPYGPLTVHDPAQVAAVVKEVNAVPVEPYGPRPCPAPRGRLDLSFRSATGTELAHAQAQIGGCDDVYLEIDSRHVTLYGAADLTRSVLGTLHLPWGPVV